MSMPVTQVPRRLAALFLLALLGILVMLGAVIGRFAGVAPALIYALVTLVAVVLGARTARRRLRALAREQGRSCTCCTTSVHDPVQVI